MKLIMLMRKMVMMGILMILSYEKCVPHALVKITTADKGSVQMQWTHRLKMEIEKKICFVSAVTCTLRNQITLLKATKTWFSDAAIVLSPQSNENTMNRK